jgi:nucleotide-binding universal stress UspA family protein
MGRRGCGVIERLLVGSNSEYCMHNAACSVLIVKDKQEA